MAKSRIIGNLRGASSYSKTSLAARASAAAGANAAAKAKSKGGTTDSERRRSKVSAARARNNRVRRENAAGQRATLQAARGFQ